MNPTLEIMESYPIDKLLPVVDWLKTTDLTPYILDNSRRTRTPDAYQNEFTSCTFVAFTGYLERYDYRTSTDWTEFCERIFPLVEYMRKQLSKLRECEYKQKMGEINILPPKGQILPHRDSHNNCDTLERVHLVLYTNPDALFTIDGVTTHFTQGCCFVFDNMKMHDVINGNLTQDRAHLVVDFEKIVPNK